MAQEIEKKFLVARDDFRREATSRTRIVQGYLSSVPERTVRVRIKGDKGYLTIKGIGNASGASRFEWETEIPLADAEDLLQIAEPGIIDKFRYFVPTGDGHRFEVDEFLGDNEGLVVAEIELNDEDDTFEVPAWVGLEITGNPRYYNSMLMKHPYKKW
ncbi:MAG: CYTH domain-containing protein [Rikenellaceae bacterium]|nr:CYTH domain-containing protein [Rikenellaceae bacterium]MCL2692210.1 CYTH domain-containing protein [Rikenellaceae bacterium]